MELARKHGLKVIEDAAHAIGSELDGRKLGTWGDMGCFSFFSNKNMTTGEGGMIVTDNDEYSTKTAFASFARDDYAYLGSPQRSCFELRCC